MADYQDVQIARRAARLIRGSTMDFSVLNFMVIVLILSLILAAFTAMLQ